MVVGHFRIILINFCAVLYFFELLFSPEFIVDNIPIYAFVCTYNEQTSKKYKHLQRTNLRIFQQLHYSADEFCANLWQRIFTRSLKIKTTYIRQIHFVLNYVSDLTRIHRQVSGNIRCSAYIFLEYR